MITKTQGAALRAIAIIGIVLHNYCHWLGFAVKENEYTFEISKSINMLQTITDFNDKWLIHFFSFWGHYGVPIFLFLSGYGLMRKYNSTTIKNTSNSMFIMQHYKKLFSMMIIGFTCFILVDAITPGRHTYSVIDILGQLFMFNNLLPHPDNVIWPGPYWFFGLMLQLYIIYRLLLHRCNSLTLISLVAICFVIQAICSPEGEALNRLRYNFIGGMLPFVGGILWQKYECEYSKTTYLIAIILSAIIIFAASFNFIMWLFAPIFVCCFAISLIKIIPQKYISLLAYVGNISAALFVVHPITRKIIIPISRHNELYSGLLLYIITSVALAWIFREIIKRLQVNYMQKK